MVDIARDTESVPQWRDVQLAAHLLMTPRIGPRTVARILLDMGKTGSLDGLLRASASDFYTQWRVPPESTKHFLRTADTPVDQLSDAQAEGGTVWLLGFPGYPQMLQSVLGKSAPPVLFAMGRLDVLDRPAFMICGSRKASDLGVGVAHACSGALAAEGINVVSGHAGGVDITAHAAALENGGVTTIVLAEGVSRFRPKAIIRPLIRPDNILVLSEFLPSDTWSPGNAMRRNLTMCGLADAVIAVEAASSGGTIAAGRTALKYGRPLFVVNRRTSHETTTGGEMLRKEGAHALPCDQEGKPFLAELMAHVQRNARRPRDVIPKCEQATLFD